MNFQDIKERTLYGALAAIVAIGCTLMGGMAFILLLLFAVFIMAQEWERLTSERGARWRLIGGVYILIPVLCLMYLRLDITLMGGREMPRGFSHHLVPTFLLFAIVWATDIAAYFFGKLFGKHKIAPEISPGKTWQGLGGGMLAAAGVTAFAAISGMINLSFFGGLFWGALFAIIAQGGDLFESSLKRAAGVKDSGSLIPGHGGLLDRVDGLLAVTPVFTLVWWIV